ncbi:MAG: sugar transferase, partial [Pseudomonadota bacterium]
RHAFARQLPLDTINDDFILPMEIVGQGKRAVYDSEIVALETAPSPEATDFARRVRIGAGNLQQAIRLRHLLNPSFGGVAFAFASGKVLRVLMPLLMLSALVGSLGLALSDNFVAPVFQVAAAAQLLGYCLAASEPMLRTFCGGCSATRVARAIRYLTVGHIASGWGALKYMRGDYRGGWRRGSLSGDAQRETLAANGGFDPSDFVPKGVRAGKRFVDIIGALVGLALTLPLFPILALAIRLDSPGPVIFRQLRVGRMEHDRTILFEMMKFRTMRSDAEAKSGAVWAQKNDPRVTRIGGFMRKTRLDELPQLLNVLRGDMSLIGPRPERPGFCGKLEDQIPLYIERTVGIRPGITGLAQVLQGYDETIDDVRSKIIFDNRYALSLTGVISWLRSDIEIVFRTMAVMVGARGR